MRSKLFWVIVLLVSSAAATRGESRFVLSIVGADNAPVRIESAQVETGAASGLRIRFVVTNLHRTAVDHLVVTAATVGGDQRVTAVRIQSVEGKLEARGRKEQFVVFPQIVPTSGERVLFGVQAVGWSDGKEWRGVLRLTPAAPASAAR